FKADRFGRGKVTILQVSHPKFVVKVSFCVSGRDATNDAIATVGFESENSAFNDDTRRLAISVFPSGGSSFSLLVESKNSILEFFFPDSVTTSIATNRFPNTLRTAEASRAEIALKKSPMTFSISLAVSACCAQPRFGEVAKKAASMSVDFIDVFMVSFQTRLSGLVHA